MKKVLKLFKIIIILTLFVVFLYFLVFYIINFIISCKIDNTFNPIIDTSEIKWASDFKNNWKEIHEEYMNFVTKYHEPQLYYKQEPVTSLSIDIKKKWKSIFLRLYNRDTEYCKYFPETMKLINNSALNNRCSTAFFSIFEPGTKLRPHRGIYKGILRYHLALQVPKKDPDKCFLEIEDNYELKRYYWKEGEDLFFDDMYKHSAENTTEETRIVLFLDIKREFNDSFLESLHEFAMDLITNNAVFSKSIKRINENINVENLHKLKYPKLKIPKIK